MQEKDFRAGLIGQPIPDVAETEPRPIFEGFTDGELLDRLEEVAEWIEANGSREKQTPWLIHRDVVREAIRRASDVGRETEYQPVRQSMPFTGAPQEIHDSRIVHRSPAQPLTGEEACGDGRHVWPPTWDKGDTCNCGRFYIFTDGAMHWIEETQFATGNQAN